MRASQSARSTPSVSARASASPCVQALVAHTSAETSRAQAFRIITVRAGIDNDYSKMVHRPKLRSHLIASCVSQAQGVNAAGIVLDAIPYGMAQNALDSAKGKGIPIVIADQYSQGAQSTNQPALPPLPPTAQGDTAPNSAPPSAQAPAAPQQQANANLPPLPLGHDDVREVRQGFECGMSIKNFNDIVEGDQFEVFEVTEVARTL